MSLFTLLPDMTVVISHRGKLKEHPVYVRDSTAYALIGGYYCALTGQKSVSGHKSASWVEFAGPETHRLITEGKMFVTVVDTRPPVALAA